MGRPTIYKTGEEKKKAILESKKTWKAKSKKLEVEEECQIEIKKELPKLNFHRLILLRTSPSIDYDDIAKKLYPEHKIVSINSNCDIKNYKLMYENCIKQTSAYLDNDDNVVVVSGLKLFYELEPYLKLCDDIGVVRVVSKDDSFYNKYYSQKYESYSGEDIVEL